MPKIIHPTVTGTIEVEMTVEDARILADALTAVLNRPAPEWVEKVIWQTVDGTTCLTFVKALRTVLERD